MHQNIYKIWKIHESKRHVDFGFENNWVADPKIWLGTSKKNTTLLWLPGKLWYVNHIDGLVQERRKFSANTLELRLSCINPSIYDLCTSNHVQSSMRFMCTLDVCTCTKFMEPGLLRKLMIRSTLVNHCNGVMISAMASQITSRTIVYSTFYWGADQRKHQSFASLAFVWGIHRWPVNSPHKGAVTRKMFPFDDVIMTDFHTWHLIGWQHNCQPVRSHVKIN